MVMLHGRCMRRARRIWVIVVTVFSMPRVRAVQTMLAMVTVSSRGLCACTQGQGSHGGYRQQCFD